MIPIDSLSSNEDENGDDDDGSDEDESGDDDGAVN